ncbi:hypothetical protein GCM10010385_37160 [Streptomyces geysiriensis]|nr:hypothetical protein GCM10010385_37160 [Streptomyces geysiriensis]GGZ47411.1 hypothetical protein GCM10010301_19970 [Streptomyces plicatus]GHC02567.1 hypothetical protein GCM10010308_13540 [Streptomyces vinaceusdrappus]
MTSPGAGSSLRIAGLTAEKDPVPYTYRGPAPEEEAPVRRRTRPFRNVVE